MEAFITNLVSHYPILTAILTGIGVLRVVMKPLFTILHNAAKAAHADKLDEQVTAVESSKVVYYLTYVLDWAASVKIGPQVPPPQIKVVTPESVEAQKKAA